MRPIVWCLAALLASGCAPRPDRAAVRAAVDRYYERLSDRDWERLRTSFWPEGTLATVWQPPAESSPRMVATPIDRFIAMAPQGPGSRSIFEERPLDIEVHVRGGVAAAWVRYAARFGEPGDLVCWTGTDAISLLRHEGEWRIASIAYANDDDGGAGGQDGCD